MMKFIVIVVVLLITHCAVSAQWVLTKSPTSLNAVGAHDQYLFVGGEDNGAFRSSDNGDTWISINNGIHSDSDPYPPTVQTIDGLENNIYTTVSYGGTYKSSDNGEHWALLFHHLSFFTLITYHNKLFSVPYGVKGVWVSSDTGKTWDTDSVGLFSGWAPDNQQIYTTPVIVSDELYTINADGKIYRSTNDGNNWTITYDRVEGIFKKPYAINDTTLFVCTLDSILRSTNRGVTWQNIKRHTGTGPLLTINNTIIAVQGYLISISSDNGDTWKSINDNLSDSTSINSMTIHNGYLFAATYQGLWKRPLSDFATVSEQPQTLSFPTLRISINEFGDHATVQYYTEEDIEHPKFEIYDILGRLLSSTVENFVQKGWNTITIPLNTLTSGTYICRASGSGFTQSRTFQISL